ncbi:DNA starvation/stationary phase protection protein [Bradyrhizobium sp. AUGA SZCCT0177]|uniref:Dps family protein n=1 Tax=Bradyrhizobium sp. AUGA SZCCT0177 TaxID=2807665 RepID=UPI001BAC374B|nr:DNA starvation/stationary phase protection protein [Bradyrhizobium sp. AUGA SZCCT0177]
MPSGIAESAVRKIAASLAVLLAEVFALYLKTKNFHWHVSGPHFRSIHLMLDKQASDLLAITNPIAERARAIGGNTLRSIGHTARLQRLADNHAEFVKPEDMLAELSLDNRSLAIRMRAAHQLCEGRGDTATASLLENWIDETERRNWELLESTDDVGMSFLVGCPVSAGSRPGPCYQPNYGVAPPSAVAMYFV